MTSLVWRHRISHHPGFSYLDYWGRIKTSWHQAAHQEWARHQFTDPSHRDLQWGHQDVIQDSYKNLGIPQAKLNHDKDAQRLATAKYLQKVRRVLRSQLNGRNKIHKVIRYPPEIIKRPQEEIDATDVKTQKLLTMHRGLHLKSSPVSRGSKSNRKREGKD